MKKIKQHLILAKDDFDVIMGYLKLARHTLSNSEAEELQAELKKARLVNNGELPEDVVRLNSAVVIKDEKDDKVLQLIVVTPEKADIKERKISVLSPIGTALIGFRKGQKVAWKVPAGKKTFHILDVKNSVVLGEAH